MPQNAGPSEAILFAERNFIEILYRKTRPKNESWRTQMIMMDKSIRHLSRLVGKPTMWFMNRSHTNQPVQAQERARSLKFWIEVEEDLYYPSSENKGADQLRGYREADLRLCFRLCRLLVFPWGGSFMD